MGMRRFLGALILLASVSSGCSDEPSKNQQADGVVTSPVPTNAYRPGMGWMQAHIDGSLSAVTDGADHCLAVLRGDGHLYSVSWPAGFSARFADPAQLLGPDGEVVATEGDHLDLGGGYGGERLVTCALGERSGFAIGPIKVNNR